MVTTVTGKTVPRQNTRNIQGRFYENNVECFVVNGSWHRFNNGRIAKNLLTNKWELISTLREQGLHPIIFDFATPQDPFLGYTDDVMSLPRVHSTTNSDVVACVSEELLQTYGFAERMADGIFYHHSSINETAQAQGVSKKTFLSSMGRSSAFNVGNTYTFSSNNALHSSIKSYFNQDKIDTTSKTLLTLEKIFKNITFGVEYEVSRGYIPRRLLFKHGLIPLRDGSTSSGVEFATLPLVGAKGYQNVYNIATDFSKRATFDETCCFHVHIGGIKRSKLIAVSLFSLISRLQNELRDLVHPCRRSLNYYKNIRKIYSKDLVNLSLIDLDIYKDGKLDDNNLQKAMNRVWNFMSGGRSPVEDGKFEKGSNPWKGSNKWNIEIRYMMVNFYNYFFSKTRTIEFRYNTPSFNHVDNLMWIMICSAICKFAELYPERILSNKEKIRLIDIIRELGEGFGYIEPSSETKKIRNSILSYIELKNEKHLEAFINGRTNFDSYQQLYNTKSFKDQLEKISFV